MKKAKERTRTKTSSKTSSAKKTGRRPVDLAEIREQIVKLVGNDAVGMVETTIEEVGKGHYLGMKYLFEVIGLYPATATDEGTVRESMAAILLRRLGVAEVPPPEQSVTKDSETATGGPEDGLE
jgi:hypothetical protein